MSRIDNGMDMLLQLQALAKNNSKSTSTTTKTQSGTGTKSFAEIWQNINKQQKEFESIMDTVDIAQYKLSLQDAFWSNQADAMKYLRNYTQRHQQAYTQQTIGLITTGVFKLQQLKSGMNYNMDPKLSQELSNQLQSALTGLMMSNIQTGWLS
ncbi:MAG: hypothetical protein K6C05_08880 [Anaerovibrio sp.]|uniref:hypothetical protein n=1 Tax=Anaerovibrio sp. TaxID=1872532 RepID=UPI0025F40FF9|nr:hypothetical protein [Anaerovibrio sp.]MCR5176945.1 hypothetical protein [Anaerovibrio sp.]